MLCFRLLNEDEPASPLTEAVDAIRTGRLVNNVYSVEPDSFQQIPNAPFAYWVSERIRQLFTELPPFEAEGRTVKQGMATADDFRFVRTSWEVPLGVKPDSTRTWYPFAKGGNYSPFYTDFFLKGNWAHDGGEIRFFGDSTGKRPRSRPQNTEYYLKPGYTYPLRTSRFSPQFMPAGVIISVRGSGIYGDLTGEYLPILASTIFDALLKLVVGRFAHPQFDMGDISVTPVPSGSLPTFQLQQFARAGWAMRRWPDTANVNSQAFFAPALARNNSALNDGVEAWSDLLKKTAISFADLRSQIDEIVYALYGLGDEDRRAIEKMFANSEAETEGEDEDDVETTEIDLASGPELVSELLDYLVGCAFGRWDIRYATGKKPAPSEPDPFDPLPVCPPGMLQNDKGLPLPPEDVPVDYPLRIPVHGILAEDGDQGDFLPRIRDSLEIIWPDRHDAIEHEACGILEIRSLQGWLSHPNKFFADHLARHSKSRRQAPVYWPLSTASGGYTLWIYYHRLTDQTLYTAVTDFVEPKITDIDGDLARLRSAGEPNAKVRAEIEALADLRNELVEFREELLRVAQLPYRPNLNDGVLITAAPLWKLFRLPKWRKALQDCWKKLEKGDYDWAHLALSIWPNRVREKCKTDKSLAIAHGLEELFEEPPEAPKKKRGNRKAVSKAPGEDIDELELEDEG